MNFSIRRVNALIKKEAIDFSKNINISFMCILPIVFAIIYSRIFDGSQALRSYILNLCINTNMVLVSGFTIAGLIAEEKEKNTLRTLMLSGVSSIEFLTGKAIITAVISIVLNILIFFIMGVNIAYLWQFIIITTLVVICMMEFGAVIGIIAENQMSTGTIGMPFFMGILLIPTFAKINDIFGTLANFLPNYNMQLLLDKIFTNKPINISFAYNMAVILIWIIIGAGVFAYTYKRRKLD